LRYAHDPEKWIPVFGQDHARTNLTLRNATQRNTTQEGPKPKTTDDIFKGKKVALFAVPGAFTPTCTNMHMPSFLNNAAAIKAKGVNTIAVTGVNDVFVMEAWKKSTGAEGKVDFLADGNGEFAKAIDMAFDGSGNGLGTRSKRYSMLVEDGVVKKLNVEEAPGKCDVSGGQALLAQL
jgi:peroxiredoxin